MIKAFDSKTNRSIYNRILRYKDGTETDINKVENEATLLYDVVSQTCHFSADAATQRTREDLIAVLVDCGAKLDQEFLGQTPLWVIARYGSAALVKKCLAVSGINTQFQFNGKTLLQAAQSRPKTDPEKATVLQAFADVGITT